MIKEIIAALKEYIVGPEFNVTFGTMEDFRDKKIYKTVKIGNQVWMAENFKYKIEGSVCYDNVHDAKKYGRLYKWDAAVLSAPSGWHLPSHEEWDELINFVGGEKIAGKYLKAESGWNCYDGGKSGNGNNKSGFSALPGGHIDRISKLVNKSVLSSGLIDSLSRLADEKGESLDNFKEICNEGNWWSGTCASNFSPFILGLGMDRKNNCAYWYKRHKLDLCSVRYVKN